MGSWASANALLPFVRQSLGVTAVTVSPDRRCVPKGQWPVRSCLTSRATRLIAVCERLAPLAHESPAHALVYETRSSPPFQLSKTLVCTWMRRGPRRHSALGDGASPLHPPALRWSQTRLTAPLFPRRRCPLLHLGLLQSRREAPRVSGAPAAVWAGRDRRPVPTNPYSQTDGPDYTLVMWEWSRAKLVAKHALHTPLTVMRINPQDVHQVRASRRPRPGPRVTPCLLAA